MTEQYLFGDSDLAARRLKVLAGAFAATSRAFVADAAPGKLHLATDLGCGAGCTTHLLADVLECEQVVGLDNSEHFISLAERTATARVIFRLHDITEVSFPDGPCDLIYARFLLTHQSCPEALIAKWATQLSSGRRLLLEETDSIETKIPVFAEYIGIAEAMLADAGRDLYVGSGLDAMATPPGLVRRSSQVARVPITNALAAKMFSMNIQTWKHNAFVQENYSSAAIRVLEENLISLAASPADETDIEWRLRQIVFERENNNEQ